MFEIRMELPRRNALGSASIAWLYEQLEAAGGEPILLSGAGGAFCAGLDLGEVAALGADDMPGFLRSVDALFSRLFEHPAPTVACVDGHAIAGGCILALCCDHRVAQASERLRIGANEVALGVPFPPATLRIARHRIAAGRAEEVLLGAGLFDPAGALARGLVDELAEDAGTTARARLEALAAHPREAYRHTKRLLRGGVATPTAEDERRFVEQELPLWTSPETRERVLRVLGR